jgi:hypothetical protein
MDGLVIKGTIWAISMDQWKNDMTLFTSTVHMVMENWEMATYNHGADIKLEFSDDAKKKIGETHQALIAFSNDIHYLSICLHQLKHTHNDPSLNNRMKALYFTNLTESYFTNLRSIYDWLAQFSRIFLSDHLLERRKWTPESFETLTHLFDEGKEGLKVFPPEFVSVVLSLNKNLQVVRGIRNAIIHDGKEPVISFEKDGLVTIKIPGKIGVYNSGNMLPDILELGEAPFSLYDYIREVTLRLLYDMENYGTVIGKLYVQQKQRTQPFDLFGLTGYCMKGFMEFLYPSNINEHLLSYK